MLDRSEGNVPGGDLDGDAEYQDYLEGIEFPIAKGDLVTRLREIGVDDSLVAHVESLTGDTVENSDDVFSGILPH
jgi:hypothetical protein